MKRMVFASGLLAVAIAFCSSSVSAKPLKVYILSGQSNMEGHAAISTFDYLAMDPKTAPILKEMRAVDGNPDECDNVWISYLTGNPSTERHGKLTAGYGAGEGGKIGPEFTFGIYMQKIVNEPILLIKTAWGGKSLHTDFRSPSAGPYQYDEQQLAMFKKRGQDIDVVKAEKAEKTGYYYRQMIDHVKMVLRDIKRVCPAYDAKEGYELAGFVWFQGWNDMVDGSTYPDRSKPGGYSLYTELLSHFIRDVRKEFEAPQMRFVIGVMGVGGVKEQPDYFRQAMAAPAAMPEFKGNVAAVLTERFWDPLLEATLPKKSVVDRMMGTAHSITEEGIMAERVPEGPGWDAVGTPAPQERTWRFISFDPQQETDKLPVSESKRFRDVALPKGLEGWYEPGFDDSQWMQGTAPIGKGTWSHRRKTVKNSSDWGDHEFLLMRTTFELDALDWESYRISILARQGFHVYLNGHKIHTYVWWKDEPYYRSIVLSEAETKHLKKGTNVLAAYANVHYDKRTKEPYASIDLAIEGITKEGKEHLHQEMDKILTPEDQEIVKGASNAGYHYLGSAKIMAQIGKAFAEAMGE